MDRQVLKMVAVRLNRGAVRGSSANLARVMGVSLATIKSWLADPNDETTYRRMTRGSRRLLATIIILDSVGLVNEKMVETIDVYDQWLNEGNSRLQKAFITLDKMKYLDEMPDEEDY
jgi:hypothetical protein